MCVPVVQHELPLLTKHLQILHHNLRTSKLFCIGSSIIYIAAGVNGVHVCKDCNRLCCLLHIQRQDYTV